MNTPRKPGFLSQPVPLWALMLAVLIGCAASGMFGFAVSFALFQTGTIGNVAPVPVPGPPAGQPPR